MSIAVEQPFTGFMALFLDPFEIALHGAQVHLIIFACYSQAVANDLGGQPLFRSSRNEAQHGHETEHDGDQMGRIGIVCGFVSTKGVHDARTSKCSEM